MHLSLYRKFRPDRFEGIVRQEHVVRVLTNQIASGTVGHAYLFTGPRGTGKTTVARIFARAVNCEHPEHGSPCGKCPSCLALAKGSLDIVEIDAASNNGVNEMRDLREKVQYPPVSAKYKVYIVDEVHMLTDSAFNALLKTLEEPPAHAIFILATTEPQKLPATIMSRCMRLDFKLIPESDLEGHLCRILKEIGKEYEPEAVAAIARAGAGSDRDMLSIAEMCIAYDEKLTYEGVVKALGAADFMGTCSFVQALLSSDSDGAIDRVENLLAAGKSVGVLCKDTLEMLNRVAVAKTCRTAERLLSLPKELFSEVKKLADGADGRAILRATEILAKTESDLRFTSSPRVLFETAILRCACPAIECDVDALTVRVAALEEKLERGVPVSAPAVSTVSEPVKPVKERAAAVSEEEEELPPPPDEPDWSFDDAPFESVADKKVSAPAAKTEEKTVTPPKAENAEVVSPFEAGATVTFGRFIRALRKNARNGVLFTLCSDLSPRFEGTKLVLSTTSDAVLRSLNRPEHRAVMEENFATVGVTDFEVRGAERAPSKADGIEELKRNFKDYSVEIKS